MEEFSLNEDEGLEPDKILKVILLRGCNNKEDIKNEENSLLKVIWHEKKTIFVDSLWNL